MKEPKKWTGPEPWTGYTITFFPDPTKYGQSAGNAYKTERGAIRAAEKMVNGKKEAAAVVRRLTIIKRTEHAEISVDSPVKYIY